MPPSSLRGPTPGSNWLIPNRLLVGECPADAEELQPILDEGIDTLVCLLDDEDFEKLPLPSKRSSFVIGTDRKVLEVISSELNMDAHADRALEVLRSRGEPA